MKFFFHQPHVVWLLHASLTSPPAPSPFCRPQPCTPGLTASPLHAPLTRASLLLFLQVFLSHLLLVRKVSASRALFPRRLPRSSSLCFLINYFPLSIALITMQVFQSIVHCLSAPLEGKLYRSRDRYSFYSQSDHQNRQQYLAYIIVRIQEVFIHIC